MASIQKRSTKNGDRWIVRWRDPDGTDRSRSFTTASTAKTFRGQVDDAERLGRIWRPEARVVVPPLSGLFDGWLADLHRIGKAPGTIVRGYYGAKAGLSFFGSEAGCDALTRAGLTAFDAHLVARGYKITSRRATMWAVMSAWRWGWAHEAWRPHLAEPAAPAMPTPELRRVVAPTWAQMDAVVHLAAAQARRLPRCEWQRRTAVLLRGLGWRITQVLGLDWTDVDLEGGRITCREGKSRQEKRGRVVPLAPWLRDELGTWSRDDVALIGRRIRPTYPAMVMAMLWDRSGVPREIYANRPDHAFRIGLISGLTALRAPHEGVEYYVGHSLGGVRRAYLDASSLGLDEVASLIPPIGKSGTSVGQFSAPIAQVPVRVGKNGSA
jgi:integrase